MSGTLTQPRGVQLWWQAVRPKTLGMAIHPVILGTALVWTDQAAIVRPQVPLVILLCAMAIQAGTNLFNDAQDFVNGTDTTNRIGPPRITALGWALPHQVSAAGLFTFLIALLGGLYLISIGRWPIFFGGLAALWAGYLYSRGPYPISRSPFGELVVIAFFGLFAVGGTVYLMSENVTVGTLLWGVIAGLPAGAVLLLNNIRDMNSDRLAGRRTLAIVAGLNPARRIYSAMVLLPFVLIGIGVALNLTTPGALLGVLALPLVLKNISALSKLDPSPALNPVLGATVRGQGLLVICAAVGLAGSRYAAL